MTDETLGFCWSCGQALTKLDYGRESTCLRCSRPTRCCKNCASYAPGRPAECADPTVERVLDKAAANFCEQFDPVGTADRGEATAADSQDALRAAAEALFK